MEVEIAGFKQEILNTVEHMLYEDEISIELYGKIHEALGHWESNTKLAIVSCGVGLLLIPLT